MIGIGVDDFYLQRLSGLEFEYLCKDLLEKELGASLEVFAEGRDGGIDLRGYLNHQRLIVQCKRWTDRNALVKRMEQIELPKVRRLNPDRYLLATTVPMTVEAKRRLSDAFAPYLAEADILGLEEVTARLHANPDIVKRHVKLWLNDMSILEAAVARDVFIRSEHLKSDLAETLRTYVPTSSFDTVIDILDKKHFCLISGSPGVGKSTLAKAVCARHAQAGFQVIEVSDDVEEAYRVWHDNLPQIFFYDDFLGRSSLGDKLHKNEDERLVSLVRRVARVPDKRFVCTTREYLLMQARQSHERLDRADLEHHTATVAIEAMSREERASILYSHVHWSRWPRDAKRAFAEPWNYRPVIDHVHFSPRVLADQLSRAPDTHCGSPIDQVTTALSDPMRLWNHIFENQLSNEDRAVLLALFTWGGTADAEVLERCVHSQMMSSSVSFRRCIRVLSGTFLDGSQGKAIRFLNPSVSDFMLRRVAADDALLAETVDRVRYFEQIIGLWRAYETDRGAEAERLDLKVVASRLEDLALTTIEAPGVAPLDLVSKLAVSLAMVNELRLMKLADRVVASLSQQGVVYRAADPEDICTLIRLTEQSWHGGIRGLHKRVLLEGGTSLFNGDKSEAGVLRAEYYARRIRRYVDDRIFQDLHASAISFVDRLSFELEWSGDVLEDDLLYLIDQFVSQFSDYERRWPAIASRLEDLPPTPEQASELELEVAAASPEYYEEEVYLIMNALLEDE